MVSYGEGHALRGPGPATSYGRMSQESLGQMSHIRAPSERLKCHLDHLVRVGTYYPLLR